MKIHMDAHVMYTTTDKTWCISPVHEHEAYWYLIVNNRIAVLRTNHMHTILFIQNHKRTSQNFLQNLQVKQVRLLVELNKQNWSIVR